MEKYITVSGTMIVHTSDNECYIKAFIRNNLFIKPGCCVSAKVLDEKVNQIYDLVIGRNTIATKLIVISLCLFL